MIFQNNFLTEYKTDRKVLTAILQALIAIIVRNEYCQHFAEAGGLELLRDILLENTDDEVCHYISLLYIYLQCFHDDFHLEGSLNLIRFEIYIICKCLYLLELLSTGIMQILL